MTRTDPEIFTLPEGALLGMAVPPGRTVAAELAARGLTANRAATLMRMPANRLGLILKGERGITADTALRLGLLFGNSAQFWMNLQSQYDLAVLMRDRGQQITAEVQAA